MREEPEDKCPSLITPNGKFVSIGERFSGFVDGGYSTVQLGAVFRYRDMGYDGSVGAVRVRRRSRRLWLDAHAENMVV